MKLTNFLLSVGEWLVVFEEMILFDLIWTEVGGLFPEATCLTYPPGPRCLFAVRVIELLFDMLSPFMNSGSWTRLPPT